MFTLPNLLSQLAKQLSRLIKFKGTYFDGPVFDQYFSLIL